MVIQITEGLPEDLSNELISNEKVYYFSYISSNGGCFNSSSRDEYWISITNKRFIYTAKVKDGNSYIVKDGILPLDQVSFIEVTESTENTGCSSSKVIALNVGTSGGNVLIPLPSKEKGKEIRSKHTLIVEFLKNSDKKSKKKK